MCIGHELAVKLCKMGPWGGHVTYTLKLTQVHAAISGLESVNKLKHKSGKYRGSMSRSTVITILMDKNLL